MDNIGYAIPYLLVLFFLVALMFFEFRNSNQGINNRYVHLAALAGLCFFFGFRGFILTDWLVYYPMFDKMPTLWDGGLLSALQPDFAEQFVTDETLEKPGTELGFVYATIFFKSIIPDYYAWVFFNTVIDFLLLSLFLKRHSPYFLLGLIFFFLFEGVVIEVNLMRNVKAILLFLISIKYLKERRFLPYLALNILGFYFHSSALIYIPLYFFLHKEWSAKIYWSVFVVGVLILLFQVTYVAPILRWVGGLIGGRLSVLIDLYLMSDLYGGAYGLFHFGYLERVFTFCLLMVFRKRLIEMNPDMNIFMNMYLIYFIIFFYFSEITIITERVPLLFVPAYWILYPSMYALVEKIINKVLFVLLFCFYGVVKSVNAYSNIMAKYDNVIFGIESYEDRHSVYVNQYDALVNKNKE